MKRRGELIKVGGLFEKYKKILIAPQASVVGVFIEVVSDLCKINLKQNQVSYSVSSRTITLHVPSILKHEILRHNQDILDHCRGRLSEKNCPKVIR